MGNTRYFLPLLRNLIGLTLIIEGADKFFNLLVDWHIYLPPIIMDIWPFSADVFLMVLGVVEMIVGIIFLHNLRIGALLVAGLMSGIIINLLLLGDYYNMIFLNLIVGFSALHSRALISVDTTEPSPSGTTNSA